jgi:AraC-like DNA-binding protein
MDELFYKKVENVLSDIENYARYGAVFYDFEGKSRPMLGGAFCRLCAACVEGAKMSGQCLQNAKSASYQAWLRGEAYTFKCWLGLYGIIVPVCPEPDGDRIDGAIEIGGLFPEGAFQSSTHQIMATLNKLDPSGRISGLVSAFQGTGEMPQMDFRSFGEFMKEAVCSSGLLDAGRFSLNSEIWSQQNRISGRAEDFRAISMDKERVLCFLALEMAKASDSGDERPLGRRIDEFLGATTAESAGNLEMLRSSMLVALAMMRMHRARRGGGASPAQLSDFSLEVENLSKESGAEQLCLKFQKMLSSQSEPAKVARTETLRKVLHFIGTRFHEDMKVEEVASYAGASASTVMHRLRDETGMSFSEHLNATRMKEAKRLLAYTDLSVGEIAGKCGFADQSYFSKVFLKHISMTPREFRRMLVKGSSPQ